MSEAHQIANELSITAVQVTAVLNLLNDGNTIPFIARYRKEATGSLDEEQIRAIADRAQKLHALSDRRQAILKAISEQDKLTPELEAQLAAATTLTELEDLYQPYKQKRRTRATIAREKGLEPLADLILRQLHTRQTPAQIAQPFLNDEITTPDEALASARDIVAETISDHAGIRAAVREKAIQWGVLVSTKVKSAEDERAVYRLYYDYQNRVNRLRPYQILAINRGEAEKILRVKIEIGERDWLMPIRQHFRPDRRSPLAGELEAAMQDAASRLLLPAIERDVRRHLTETAETHAIHVFAANLRGLLTQPPMSGHTVLAIDPGYRTGCKVAVTDPTGKVLDTATIYPHPPQNRKSETLQTLAQLVQTHHVTLIAIGNGTASRETEQLVAEFIQSQSVREQNSAASPSLHYLMVNEAGASVYSASPLARAELPELDVTLRGAVSIGRRVQDPLAELVKIDPKSIGVGLYQHDVDQKQLAAALDGVVESVVNQVGVDVNTASPALLGYVAGIGPKLAEKVVAHRDGHGRFPDRQSLLNVPGLGPKAFEQAAGFLRIRNGRNPLDASAIHPESYPAAEALLAKVGLTPAATLPEREQALAAIAPSPQLAAELQIGLPTLQDILEQLVRPGRDPREDLPKPILRQDVLSMDELTEGMQLQGTVRNVIDFGAFVDIGVKQDGLLHRSQLPPEAALSVGDVITVVVLSVDIDRGRISLGWGE
ncbi:MAG: Tex family protein [Candidatus Promineifilaceae bacterium]